MRDPEIIEAELMEIGALADDTAKFELIIAWCAAHPDEVAFAPHELLGRHDKPPVARFFSLTAGGGAVAEDMYARMAFVAPTRFCLDGCRYCVVTDSRMARPR
jgi:hypothetical protein